MSNAPWGAKFYPPHRESLNSVDIVIYRNIRPNMSLLCSKPPMITCSFQPSSCNNLRGPTWVGLWFPVWPHCPPSLSGSLWSSHARHCTVPDLCTGLSPNAPPTDIPVAYSLPFIKSLFKHDLLCEAYCDQPISNITPLPYWLSQSTCFLSLITYPLMP